MECPQCGTEVVAGARFCSSCGHELVVVGDQRRIATVLFADLVGFTALSETLDPEQVKALVDTCFERLAKDIEAFGGRVDKVVGDAIVALFGAPVAHEDDAERAVRAGLRMQETIATIEGADGAVQMRVGVNTGEVLVGAVRAGREYTAMGDVVNTASRLQDACPPGSVLVGPETYASTSDVVEYESVDAVIAKGKRLPVHAWVAKRAIAPPGQRVRETQAPMVGRETELAILTSLTSTTLERSRAALLVVHGEAGMGKSRLAAETAAYAEQHLGAFVLEGRCVPYGEANVWWPVAEAVRNAGGLAPDASREDVDAALRRATTAALKATAREDEVERVVAGLQHLLGHDSLRGIDVASARDEAIRSVVALAEGYSHKQPVFIVLSDLHWAADEVLDLVEALLGRLARRPIVIMATARRSLRDRWTPTLEAANTVALHLDPLNADDSRRLLELLSDGSLHPSMAAMLVDRAGGNPFYLEELVALISEAGVQTVDQLLASEAGDLPSTLRGLVAARLDALTPEDRRILDDAAVLGRRNKIDALITMAQVKHGTDRDRVRDHLERLAAREFLLLEDGNYSFRSDVIREVAYSTLTKADRARSHAGIAYWIEQHEDDLDGGAADQIASHWAAAAELVADIGSVAGVPEDVAERAIDRLRQASERAEADSFPATVNSLSTRTLELMGSDHPDRGRVLRHRAAARVDLFDLDGAVADTLEAESLARAAGDERAIAENLVVRAEALRHRAQHAEALELLHEARERFASVGHAVGEAKALRIEGMVHMFGGDFVRADDAMLRAAELYEQEGDRRGVAWCQQNLSWSAYMSGRVDEAEQRVVASMETFEELGDPGGLTWARGLLAWVRFHQGADDEAVRIARAVRDDARERGEPWGEAMMEVLIASVSLWSGATAEAVESGRHSVELFNAIDDQNGAQQARCNLARALLMMGDIDAGIAELRTAIDSGLGDEERTWMARVSALAAAAQLGDVDLAAEVVGDDDSFGRPGSLGSVDHKVAVALVAMQRGDTECATDALDALSGAAEDRGYADCARALFAALHQQPDDVLQHAAALDSHPHSYVDRAYADIAVAIAHVRAERVEEARRVVAEAIEAAEDTGDRLLQAILRLADAEIAEVAGRSDADRARTVAEDRLATLGIRAQGWRTLLRDGLPATIR